MQLYTQRRIPFALLPELPLGFIAHRVCTVMEEYRDSERYFADSGFTPGPVTDLLCPCFHAGDSLEVNEVCITHLDVMDEIMFF